MLGKIAYAILISFLTVSLILTFEYYQGKSRLRQREKENEIAFSLDLTKAGEYSFDFTSKTEFLHSYEVFIELDSYSGTQEEASELVAGLEGLLKIEDAEGKLIKEVIIEAGSRCLWQDPARPIIAYQGELISGERNSLSRIKDGDYKLKASIYSGAPKLAGLNYKLHAENHDCGCRGLANSMIGLLAVAIAISGLCLGAICKFLSYSRKGRNNGAVDYSREDAINSNAKSPYL